MIAQKGLAPSREKAKSLLMAGLVEVDGKRVDKAGCLVPPTAEIHLVSTPSYVSRGGQKLEAALDHFGVDVTGMTLLDIGASTGGFTDCLLQRGADRIIAVDVGHGQFDWKLRQDHRVRLLEKTNIRYLKPEDLRESVQGAVIDVSFISLELVALPVSALLEPHALIITLIKPQFEVGKKQVGKGGVVRDAALHQIVIDRLKEIFKDMGWQVMGDIPSPILGPKGNREFLMYVVR